MKRHSIYQRNYSYSSREMNQQKSFNNTSTNSIKTLKRSENQPNRILARQQKVHKTKSVKEIQNLYQQNKSPYYLRQLQNHKLGQNSKTSFTRKNTERILTINNIPKQQKYRSLKTCTSQSKNQEDQKQQQIRKLKENQISLKQKMKSLQQRKHFYKSQTMLLNKVFFDNKQIIDQITQRQDKSIKQVVQAKQLQIESLRKKIIELEQEKFQLNKKSDRQQYFLQKSQRQLKQESDKITEYQNKNNELAELISKLKNQIKSLNEKQIQNQKDKIKQCKQIKQNDQKNKQKYNQLNMKSRKLQKQLQEFKQQIKKLNEQKQFLQQQNKKLKKQIQSSKKAANDEKLQLLREKNIKKQSDNRISDETAKLKQQIVTLKKNNDALMQKISAKNQNSSQKSKNTSINSIKQKHIQIQKSKNQIENQIKENTNNKKQIEKYKIKVQTYQDIISKLTANSSFNQVEFKIESLEQQNFKILKQLIQKIICHTRTKNTDLSKMIGKQQKQSYASKPIQNYLSRQRSKSFSSFSTTSSLNNFYNAEIASSSQMVDSILNSSSILLKIDFDNSNNSQSNKNSNTVKQATRQPQEIEQLLIQINNWIRNVILYFYNFMRLKIKDEGNYEKMDKNRYKDV